MASSDGFRTMDLPFSVMDSALRFGRNRHWSSVFQARSTARCSSNAVCIRPSARMFPLVRRLGIAKVAIGRPKQVRATPFCVARAARFSDFDEAQRAHLSQSGRDGVPVDTVLDELVERHRQLAIVVAGMVGEFNFEPIENAVARKLRAAKAGDSIISIVRAENCPWILFRLPSFLIDALWTSMS